MTDSASDVLFDVPSSRCIIPPPFKCARPRFDIRHPNESSAFPNSITTGENVQFRDGTVGRILKVCFLYEREVMHPMIFVQIFYPRENIRDVSLSEIQAPLDMPSLLSEVKQLVRTNIGEWRPLENASHLVFPLHLSTVKKHIFGNVAGRENVYVWNDDVYFDHETSRQPLSKSTFIPPEEFNDLGFDGVKSETMSMRLMRGCCNACENNQNKLWKGSKISSKKMTIILPKSFEQHYWEEGEIKRYTEQNQEQISSLVNNSPKKLGKKEKTD